MNNIIYLEGPEPNNPFLRKMDFKWLYRESGLLLILRKTSSLTYEDKNKLRQCCFQIFQRFRSFFVVNWGLVER